MLLLIRICRKVIRIFFRPSDKFYFELDLWETDFEDHEETALKIADLRFVLERGFDLKKHVMDYMNSLPLVPGYQEPIRSAFRRYIKFMRTGILSIPNAGNQPIIRWSDWLFVWSKWLKGLF